MSEEAKAVAKRKGVWCADLLLFIFLCGSLFLGFMNFAKAYGFDAKLENEREVGTGDEIRIDFNQPVMAIGLDSIKIDPFVGFAYRLSDDREQLVITPNRGFEFEEKYKISLSGIRGLSGLVMEDKQFIFYTPKDKVAPAPVSAVAATTTATDEEFSSLKLSPVASADKPAASVPAKKDSGIQAHITSGKYIDVSISKQLMTLFVDGDKVKEFRVSTGKPGMDTPTGQFAVLGKEKNHWSNKYKLWMPWSLNFSSGGYFIHELPYWPNGYHESVSHLGRKVSHGCVRLGPGSAEYVFNWASVGTPVYIHK